MLSTIRFLLVNGSQNKHWYRALKSALATLGRLDQVEEKDTLTYLDSHKCALIFIDATTVAEPSSLIRIIRSRWQRLPIIVASAAPEWEQARSAMRSGATNYISKSYQEKELYDATLEVLKVQESLE